MINHGTRAVPIWALSVIVVAACASAPTDESERNPEPLGAIQQAFIPPPHDILSGPWGAVGYQDTFVGADAPTQNHATEPTLEVGSAGHDRSLVRASWSRPQLPAPPGSPFGAQGTIVGATLTLTIAGTSGDWGPSGRVVAIHRLTTEWNDTEATWTCGTTSCPPRSWRMDKHNIKHHPYSKTPTATSVVTSGQTGAIAFDVTADVAAFTIDPAINWGWVVRLVDEDTSAAVSFGSVESATPPDLQITANLTNVSSVCRAIDCAIGNNTPPCGVPTVLRCQDFCRFGGGRHLITGQVCNVGTTTLTSAPYQCVCTPPFLPTHIP